MIRGPATSAVRRAAERLGFDLVHRDYYSPIPDRSALDAIDWAARSPLWGIDWDDDAQLRELDALGPACDELEAKVGVGELTPFEWTNPSYGPLDAHVLYALIRTSRPGKILEIGSGWSTVVSAAAASANAADGDKTTLSSFDPFPPPFLRGELPGLSRLSHARGQDLPRAEFEGLAAGDILFLDTTHTVKTGSEVNRFLLEILPTIAPGVLVHVHDIFLPWEYPREWIENRGYYWAEQYLLQALLAENPNWRVLFGLHHLGRAHREHVQTLIPSFGPRTSASAFWILRT